MARPLLSPGPSPTVSLGKFSRPSLLLQSVMCQSFMAQTRHKCRILWQFSYSCGDSRMKVKRRYFARVWARQIRRARPPILCHKSVNSGNSRRGIESARWHAILAAKNRRVVCRIATWGRTRGIALSGKCPAERVALPCFARFGRRAGCFCSCPISCSIGAAIRSSRAVRFKAILFTAVVALLISTAKSRRFRIGGDRLTGHQPTHLDRLRRLFRTALEPRASPARAVRGDRYAARCAGRVALLAAMGPRAVGRRGGAVRPAMARGWL